MPYRIVDDYLPILIVRREGAADAASVGSMLAWVEKELTRAPGKCGYVYDAGTNAGGLPDAAARKVGGDWIASRAGLLRKKTAGLDFVFASPMSRGALTAVFWIAAPPVPITIHATLTEAVASAVARTGARHDAATIVRALGR